MSDSHALQTHALHLHPPTQSHYFIIIVIIIVIIIIIALLHFPEIFLHIHQHDLPLELFGLCLLSLCG